MPRVRPWYGVAIVTGIAVACAPKEPPPPAIPAVDTARVTSELATFWKQWEAADTARNMEAMGALLADSIRIDSKGTPPMLGKASWQNMVRTMLTNSKVVSEVIDPDETVVISNDLAYQNGDYVEGLLTGKQRSTDYGRYAAAFERSPDGKWRLRYIMAFSDSTVAAK
jgi:hypothetical protein